MTMSLTTTLTFYRSLTFSTAITLMRIAMVPFIIGAMRSHDWGLACGLFITAGLTDALDGSLARLLNEQTMIGALLDPVADKFLIVAAYTTLSFVDSPLFIIPHWFVYIVLSKELLQIIGVLSLLVIKGPIAVKPTRLAKATMFVQSLFIVWLFLCYFMQWLPVKTYYTMLGVVLLLVGGCFAQYARIGYHLLFI